MIPRWQFGLSLFVFTRSIYGQSLTPPTLWNYNVTQLHQERVDIARAALDKGISMLVTDGMFPGDDDGSGRNSYDFYTSLVNFDIVTKQNKFEDLAVRFLTRPICAFAKFVVSTGNGEGWMLRDPIRIGYAAIRGYKAYGKAELLREATTCWELANTYTISDSTFVKDSTKGFKILKECPTKEECAVCSRMTKGGTFHSMRVPVVGHVEEYYRSEFLRNRVSREKFILLLETLTTDLIPCIRFYFLLSALLAETTHNETYTSAAQQTANFLYATLNQFRPNGFMQSNGFQVDEGNELACHGPLATKQTFDSNAFSNTSTVGFLIEGLSALASTTGNTTVEQLLKDTIINTFEQSQRLWPGPTGALRNDFYRTCRNPFILELSTYGDKVHDGDMPLVRGMAETHRRNQPFTAEIREYIKAFIGVQYNSILTEATTSNTNAYGTSWVGPLNATFDPTSQAHAVQVLLDAIDTFSDTPLDPPPNVPSEHSSSPLGPKITGAVIGSIVGVVLLGICVWFVWRRRQGITKPNTSSGEQHPTLGQFEVTPFDWEQYQQNIGAGRSGGEKSSTLNSINQSNTQDPDAASGDSSKLEPLRGHHEDVQEGPSLEPVASGSGMATVPELVRLLYQRMWEHESHESPPDYRSQIGQ
ncbi:hypothetical protein VNI00_008157 [Paramarasmius palmivorus]|uniref:Glycoside hydrolase family 76 protein n=1 Tax=Paramarasmius palmivorus TaxID=297713 RepID=A0AAW0CXY4_9AGAR